MLKNLKSLFIIEEQPIHKVNLNGFNYLGFKKSPQSLQKTQMDEGTACQSAFVMTQTMGETPAHLIKTTSRTLLTILKTQKMIS